MTFIDPKYLGRRVFACRPGPEGASATVALYGGGGFVFVLEADCCSRSYFVDPGQFAELVGRELLAVEEREGGEQWSDGGGELVRSHFLVITTDKGHVTIDWRNESNGYYDGSVAIRELAQ